MLTKVVEDHKVSIMMFNFILNILPSLHCECNFFTFLNLLTLKEDLWHIVKRYFFKSKGPYNCDIQFFK